MRYLRANEVEARVAQCTQKGVSLLLYKNARCDMAILDETFGQFGWQRKHEFKDGKLYCTVSVKDPESGEWVSKEDVGTESNQEAEKGQASDSFKRACFNWGIGRELYTAPFIWVDGSKAKISQKNNRWVCYERFRVDVFEVDDGQVSKLSISNSNGACVYKWTSTPKQGENASEGDTEALRASVDKGIKMCADKYDIPQPLVKQITENEVSTSIGNATDEELELMRSYLLKAFKGDVKLTEV